MAKSLKDKLVDMVVMTLARDATRGFLNKAKKAIKETKSKSNVRKRDTADDDVDSDLEP